MLWIRNGIQNVLPVPIVESHLAIAHSIWRINILIVKKIGMICLLPNVLVADILLPPEIVG